MQVFTALLSLYWSLNSFVLATESVVRDYCLDESFTAACDGNDVIMIESAYYGRMEFGTCVQRDYGYIGCQADVTETLSNHCSGRKSCEVVNFETLFSAYQKCPSDLKSYLEANSSCRSITQPRDTHSPPCLPGYVRPETNRKGLLSSVEQSWGTRSCPWILSGRPGQHINLTLYDFSSFRAPGNPNPAYCRPYVQITEGGRVKNIMGCNNEPATRTIYLSATHEISLAFTINPQKVEGVTFLVKYEVVGCPAPVIPDNAYAVINPDNSVTLQCNYSSHAWTLTCGSIGEWNGQLGNCSARSIAEEDSVVSLGVSIIIIVGVALLVCTAVLLIGFLIISCRRRSREHSRLTEEQRCMATYSKSPNKATIVSARSTPVIQKHATLDKCRAGYSPLTQSRTIHSHTGVGGEYTHIWEVKHPIPVATPEVPKLCVEFHKEPVVTSVCTPRMTSSHSSPTMASARSPAPDVTTTRHPPGPRPVAIPRVPTFSTFRPDGEIYESPQFKTQRSQNSSHSSHSSPLYFEIDTRKKATNHYST